MLCWQTAILLAGPSTDDGAPQPIKVSAVPYTISVLDTVKLDSSSAGHQVDQTGQLDLGDGDFKAAGLTVEELSDRIRADKGKDVSFTILEFRPNRVSVLGEVGHPLFAEMSDGPMRILDAIASASGFTPLANTRRVKLVRENAGKVEVYELDLRAEMKGDKSNQNILLKPGDVITVPRNFL